MNFDALYGEVLTYFGQRLETPTFSPGVQEFTGVLYGAMQITCRLDPVTEDFSAAIAVGSERRVTQGPRGPFASAGDRESVLTVFAALDEACRSRLPDEYLAVFDTPFDRSLRQSGPRSGRPPAPTVPYPELYALVLEFFGSRLSCPTSDERIRKMTGILYDAFPLSLGYDEQTTIFGAGITISPGRIVTVFLGSRTSMNSDRESILESLQLVDRYCRLRLPAKYREAFESAYGPAAGLAEQGGCPAMSFPISQQFTEWMLRAGFVVSGSAADASTCVANEGGEIRFYVRVSGAGQFALTRAERAEAEQLVIRADDLRDIERFLIVTVAGAVRCKEGFRRLQIPSKADELAEGFQIVHRDGFVWLDDGQRPTMCFVEEDPAMPQPAVQFSHYANASIGDLISSIDRLATVFHGDGGLEVHTIPFEFVEWAGFSLGPLGEGDLTAVVGPETSYAIRNSGGFFQVLRWERGAGPNEVAGFAHEIDALRQLMLILGGAGRSDDSFARLRVPPEISTAVAGALVDHTETGSVRLNWDEGGERHRGTFRKAALGHMNARKFAQCIGTRIPELADSLRSADGRPIFQPEGWTLR